jgi:hypothetical protein
MLALAGLTGIAHAVEFDEKLTAPAMKSAAEFKIQAQAFTKKYAEIREATPAQLITNASLAKQQFDLKWQIERAIDERKPLSEMAELGFVSRGDGSYTVDMDAHPEWNVLTHALVAAVLPDSLDNTVAGLVQRGFRPTDVASLRDYLARHEFSGRSNEAIATVSIGFGRAVRKHDQLKLPVPDSLVHAFMYQRMRVSEEADRNWAADLLKTFDAQRQRILLSIAMEMRVNAILAPEDISSGIPQLLAEVRRPDYEQRVIAESRGVAP